MSAEQQFCYANLRGEKVFLFTLRNSRGTEVKISNYGATITCFKTISTNGIENDIVLGFDRMEDYMSPSYLAGYPWFGCAVGRYANRIRNANFKLRGRNYKLTRNKGAHQLHGGITGFDRRIWNPGIFDDTPLPCLELQLLSWDGEEGFPGNLNVTIRFELSNDDVLMHQYTARTDVPTPCNLTHHSYFNLNNGEGSIFEQEVRIYASEILEQDDELVATGNILPVEGTAFDLREFRQIGEGLKRISEYDKSYVTDHIGEMPLVAEARYLPRGIGLQVFSSEPIVHFYSGKWTPEVVGKNGTTYGPWSGFCLETHKHPNAVNIADFPDTILSPGETYRQETSYKIVTL